MRCRLPSVRRRLQEKKKKETFRALSLQRTCTKKSLRGAVSPIRSGAHFCAASRPFPVSLQAWLDYRHCFFVYFTSHNCVARSVVAPLACKGRPLSSLATTLAPGELPLYKQNSTARARSIYDIPASCRPLHPGSCNTGSGVAISAPSLSPVTVSFLRHLQATRESKLAV